MYLFAIYHKNVSVIYKFVKSRIDNVYDVKYITTYSNLVYHYISDGRNSLKELLKVRISITDPLEVKEKISQKTNLKKDANDDKKK